MSDHLESDVLAEIDEALEFVSVDQQILRALRIARERICRLADQRDTIRAQLSEKAAELARQREVWKATVRDVAEAGKELSDVRRQLSEAQARLEKKSDLLSRALTHAVAVSHKYAEAQARLAEINVSMRNAYCHIQHEAYNDALSSILEAQGIVNAAPVSPAAQADYWLDGLVIRKGKEYVAEIIGQEPLLLRELLTGKPAAQVAQGVADDAQQSIDRLLESAWWPTTIEHSCAYERFQDDTDGEFTPDHILSVVFGRDGDAWLKVPRAPHSLRFRTYVGGGMSLRVRNALLLLAEAIRRDNEEAPQRPMPAMLAAQQQKEGKS